MDVLTPAAVRAAKAVLGWDNGELAQRAGLSRNTVQALQARDEITGTVKTLKRIRQALEAEGIRFIEDRQTGAYGVMFKADQP